MRMFNATIAGNDSKMRAPNGSFRNSRAGSLAGSLAGSRRGSAVELSRAGSLPRHLLKVNILFQN